MAKVKAGEGTCPACGERIVWRLADSGSLSCFCQDCDFQGYAKNGTQAKALMLAKIGHQAQEMNPAKEGAPPVQGVEPAPVPKPKPPKAAGVFGLGGF